MLYPLRLWIRFLPSLAAEAQGGPPPSPLATFLPIILIIFVFYFLLIRPQRKYQKERQAMINAIKKHDQILTRGGIYGTVVDVRPERQELVVEIAKNTRVRIARNAVEAVIPKQDSAGKEDRENRSQDR